MASGWTSETLLEDVPMSKKIRRLVAWENYQIAIVSDPKKRRERKRLGQDYLRLIASVKGSVTTIRGVCKTKLATEDVYFTRVGPVLLFPPQLR